MLIAENPFSSISSRKACCNSCRVRRTRKSLPLGGVAIVSALAFCLPVLCWWSLVADRQATKSKVPSPVRKGSSFPNTSGLSLLKQQKDMIAYCLCSHQVLKL